MKVSIYLTAEGQERLALGQKLYQWYFAVRLAEDEGEPDPSYVKIGEAVTELPDRELCVKNVTAKLKATEQEIQAEAYKELQAIAKRREALLCLSYSDAAVSEVTTDEVSGND